MGVRGTIEISRSALRHNLAQIRGHVSPQTEIVAVIKANAYGHGAVEVAHTLSAEGVRWFGVATLEEAIELRDAGIDAEILLFENAEPSDAAEILDRRLTPVVRDLELATALSHEAEKRFARRPLAAATSQANEGIAGGKVMLPSEPVVSVHVEVETGMYRSGVTLEDYPRFLTALAQLRNLRVEGVFSHLACSEKLHCRRTDHQVKLFHQFIRLTREAGLRPRYIHLANSGGVFLHPPTHFDMVRPGISLYGLPRTLDGLRPAMTFKTRIVEMRKVKAREQIGYGKSYITPTDTVIATLPIGYGDGYPRVLSNRAQVLVRGRRVPVVGRVSMDLMTVDVGGCPGAAVGDEVVLIGKQGSEEIAADELAAWAEMIPYEITTGLSGRLPRVLKE